MEVIFFLGVIILIIALVVWSVVVLRFFVDRFSDIKLSFKGALQFFVLWSLVTAMVQWPIDYALPIVSPILLNLALGYGVFYYFLKQRKQVSHMSAVKTYFAFWLVAIVVTISVVVLVRSFVFGSFVIAGDAMNPTLQTGDYLVVNQMINTYERGDIVVYESEAGQYFVQRVIGLPNEEVSIEDGVVAVNGKMLDEPYVQGNTVWEEGSINIGQDEYFLMGDNRESSKDSRVIGAVSSDRVLGKYFTKIDIFSQRK